FIVRACISKTVEYRGLLRLPSRGMKKTLFRLALIFTGLIAFGCTQKESTKKLKIGVSIPAADHGWTAGVGYWAETEKAKYPDIEWIYATAGEAAKQTGDIEDMMTKQIDGLVVLATEPTPVRPVVEKATQRGIYVVSVDRGFDPPIADVFLEGDNKAFGRK